MKRKTPRERAGLLGRRFASERSDPDAKVLTMSNAAYDSARATGYAFGWLAGHRAGKREGKAEAMTACGWGDERGWK